MPSHLGKKASLFMNGHSILGNGSQIDAVELRRQLRGHGARRDCRFRRVRDLGQQRRQRSPSATSTSTTARAACWPTTSAPPTSRRATTRSSASGRRSRCRASGVVANRNGISGLLRATPCGSIDSTMSGSGSHGLSAYTTFKGTNVIVRDNGSAGIVGGHVNGTKPHRVGKPAGRRLRLRREAPRLDVGRQYGRRHRQLEASAPGPHWPATRVSSGRPRASRRGACARKTDLRALNSTRRSLAVPSPTTRLGQINRGRRSARTRHAPTAAPLMSLRARRPTDRSPAAGCAGRARSRTPRRSRAAPAPTTAGRGTGR